MAIESVKRVALGSYATALAEALHDLAEVNASLQKVKEEAASYEKRAAELRALADNLWQFLPESERSAFSHQMQELRGNVQLQPHMGSEIYKNVIRLVFDRDAEKKDWSAQEIKDRLYPGGTESEAKAIYNCLDRLARNGALFRVRRGLYRVPEYGVTVELADEEYQAMSSKRTS